MLTTKKILHKLTLFALSLTAWSLLGCQKEKGGEGSPEEIDVITDSLSAGNLAGASRLTESLKATALKRGDSLLWSEAMVQQGVNAYYQRNPEMVYASADTAKRWLERRPDAPGHARLLMKVHQLFGGYFEQYHFNTDSLASHQRKSIEYSERASLRRDLPQLYGNYANSLRMRGELDSAAIYYHRAIILADSLEIDSLRYIPLYNGIGGVFSDMKDFERGEEWLQKSMQQYSKMDQFDKFATLTSLANLYYYQENYRETERQLTQLNAMLDSLPDTRWDRAFNDVNLGDTYIRLGRVDEALSLLKPAEEYFRVEQPNPVIASYIHTLLIRAATAKGNLAKGLEMASAYPEADTLRIEQHLARLKSLEELYASAGRPHEAYAMRLRHDALNDSLRSFQLRQRISALHALYERDHRILSLEAENTRTYAHIYKLLAVIAASAIVIIGLMLLNALRRIRARKREDRMMAKIIKLREENLRNRVTPHFIYNALNHELYREHHGEKPHLDHLIDLIRRQQFVASKLLIPFSEELRFVEDYIAVVKEKGSSEFQYLCTIDPAVDTDFMFPSMALQILVENSFKHGFSTLPSSAARRLEISVSHAGASQIEVRVINNFGDAESIEEHGGTGLMVLLETIKLIKEKYRKTIRFHIGPEKDSDGQSIYSAVITLPAVIEK